MKRGILAAVLLLCGLGSAFAAAPSNPLDAFKGQKGVVDIAGGTAHIPVMRDAAKQIMAANPDIRITVAAGGSGVGVQKVGEGIVQIGNTGRALKPVEVEKYGLVTFPFAIDGVAVAVNPANKVAALTKDQIKDIFSGKIENWKEVGGVDAPISLYMREDGSGTRETFENCAMDKGVPTSKASVVNSNGAMKTILGQDPNAIGYLGIGHLDKSIKGVSIDGAAPSQENAKSGEYKVTRLLYMNTKGEPQGLTKAFVEYIFSPAGQAIVSSAGYIPYDPK